MTIENGYYISERTSKILPTSYKNADTFYLPVDICQLEDGTYEFKEYRFKLPIDYDFPIEIIKSLAEELDSYRKALDEIGVTK